ncbi:purU [Wigglesworthia glossinidia endosymbiont of Glossina brevipalpis]|uniref:Formyltetrahydrofolate deformylase n=1 Tax=Wigglesworthia glossinidia brevipalpis TaxID=36870 RepID=Q8D2I4_WIGBR|nr:purU [Wigglesworthia glossinidia endosymbiont of Glossina brevipalpis]
MCIFQKNLNLISFIKKIIFIICYKENGIINKIFQIFTNQLIEIITISTHLDNEIKLFFIRIEIKGFFNEKYLSFCLNKALPYGSKIFFQNIKIPKIVIMVTKESHCIGDLLVKKKFGNLNVEIIAIISNYKILKSLAKLFEIPFYHVSHISLSREDHNNKILNIIQILKPDYIILAKYMRILTSSFIKKYINKIINIHHSILPSFIGAKPYFNAYQRGVKIIGATAHYVNINLDSGPIIFQDSANIEYNYSVNDIISIGREVEKYVLSRALYLVFSNRVIVFKDRAIVF